MYWDEFNTKSISRVLGASRFEQNLLTNFMQGVVDFLLQTSKDEIQKEISTKDIFFEGESLCYIKCSLFTHLFYIWGYGTVGNHFALAMLWSQSNKLNENYQMMDDFKHILAGVYPPLKSVQFYHKGRCY